MPKKDKTLQTIRKGRATTHRAKPTVQMTTRKGKETIHRRPLNTNMMVSVACLAGGERLDNQPATQRH